MSVLLAAVGGGLGAAVRFLLGHLLPGPWHPGTLVANIAGSFVLGLLLAHAVSGNVMALLGTGFCGGLTTYSAFAVQTVDLPPRRAVAYACLTLGGCLAAAWFGLSLR